jgi:hypothetical protein
MPVLHDTFDQEFLSFIAQKELRIPVDSLTHEALGLHARSWRANPRDTEQTVRWMPAAGTGTIVSHVIFHRQYSPDFPLPHIVALVELTEGPQLLGRLVDIDATQIAAGLAVTVDFDKKGLIFRPSMP